MTPSCNSPEHVFKSQQQKAAAFSLGRYHSSAAQRVSVYWIRDDDDDADMCGMTKILRVYCVQYEREERKS